MDLEKTQNPESFITYRQYHNLISQGVQISGNTYFWLTRLYQELKGHSNPFMMYCLNAPTLGEAVSRHKNYYKVINTGLDVVFEYREGYYILRRQTRSPDLELSEAMADWGFSQWYHLVELFTGPVGALKGINMVSDSVPRKKKYEEYFGVPVKANSTANELLYSQNADQLPNSRGVFDPNLDTVLQPLLDKMLSAMDNPSTLEENLLRAVQKVLMDGPPALNLVARKMAMGPRTLQRRLKDEGLYFSDVVKKHRLTLAANYLMQKDLNITDVAVMVGYERLSSFTTAFLNFHGVTPSEYRRNLKK